MIRNRGRKNSSAAAGPKSLPKGIPEQDENLEKMFSILKSDNIREFVIKDWHRLKLMVASIYHEMVYKLLVLLFFIVHYLLILDQLITGEGHGGGHPVEGHPSENPTKESQGYPGQGHTNEGFTALDHLWFFCDITQIDIFEPPYGLGIDPQFITQVVFPDSVFVLAGFCIVVMLVFLSNYLVSLDHKKAVNKHPDLLMMEDVACSWICRLSFIISYIMFFSAVFFSAFVTYRESLPTDGKEDLVKLEANRIFKNTRHYFYLFCVLVGIITYRGMLMIHREQAVTMYARKTGWLPESNLAYLKASKYLECLIMLLFIAHYNMAGLVVVLVVGDLITQYLYRGRHAFHAVVHII